MSTAAYPAGRTYPRPVQTAKPSVALRAVPSARTGPTQLGKVRIRVLRIHYGNREGDLSEAPRGDRLVR